MPSNSSGPYRASSIGQTIGRGSAPAIDWRMSEKHDAFPAFRANQHQALGAVAFETVGGDGSARQDRPIALRRKPL